MKHKLSHFALHVDDIDRAQRFYGALFNWNFQSYGPEDFKQITTGESDDQELIGALQSRRYSPVSEKILGMEGTIVVEDVDVFVEKIENNGGVIVMEKAAIPSVGWIVKFKDTEGNLVCIMSIDPLAK